MTETQESNNSEENSQQTTAENNNDQPYVKTKKWGPSVGIRGALAGVAIIGGIAKCAKDEATIARQDRTIRSLRSQRDDVQQIETDNIRISDMEKNGTHINRIVILDDQIDLHSDAYVEPLSYRLNNNKSPTIYLGDKKYEICFESTQPSKPYISAPQNGNISLDIKSGAKGGITINHYVNHIVIKNSIDKEDYKKTIEDFKKDYLNFLASSNSNIYEESDVRITISGISIQSDFATGYVSGVQDLAKKIIDLKVDGKPVQLSDDLSKAKQEVDTDPMLTQKIHEIRQDKENNKHRSQLQEQHDPMWHPNDPRRGPFGR